MLTTIAGFSMILFIIMAMIAVMVVGIKLLADAFLFNDELRRGCYSLRITAFFLGMFLILADVAAICFSLDFVIKCCTK